MKVESIIKRNPPTRIRIGGQTYQFEIDADGCHVCEISDHNHLSRLLSIPEGYRLAGQAVPVAAPVAAPAAQVILPPPELKGSPVHPREIDLGDGRIVQLDDVVKQAFDASGMTADEWNEQDEDDRYAKIDAIPDAMVAPQEEESELEGDLNGDGSLDREELANLYEARFGKRPHGKWTAVRIQEELNKDAE